MIRRVQQRQPRTDARQTRSVLAALLAILVLAALHMMVRSAHASSSVQSRISAESAHFEPSNVPNNPVRFSARTAFYSLFISDEEADIVLRSENVPNELSRGKLIVVTAYANLVRMRFAGSNLPTAVRPLGLKDESRPPYTAVVYSGIYPGTDVVLRAHARRIAFQVNLSAGADPENIVLELAGVTMLKLNNAGDAIVNAGHASFILQKPVVHLEAEGSRELASGAYIIEHENRLRFMIPGSTSANRQTMGD